MRARRDLLLLCLVYWLAFFVAWRLVFLGYHGTLAAALPLSALIGTIWHGLRLDLSAVAYISLVPFLLIALSTVPALQRLCGRLFLILVVVATTALSFLAASDLGIFTAWGRRIDAAVLSYLPYPREMWASAGSSGPWALLGIFALVTIGFLAIAFRFFRRRLRELPVAHPAAALPLLFVAALLFIPARGGFQQIPINQSAAAFSAEPFANQAALNVAWNFFDSWAKGQNRRVNPYIAMPADSARSIIAAARADTSLPLGTVLSVPHPSVLLIVWESFSARSVTRLGGVPGATPEFDSLAGTGLLFTRFYAAGDRTEKGIAALLGGAPTVPTASILMVPSKARTLPMLSKDLRAAGYGTAFYYGGELGFGNLKSFMLEGRVDHIVGKTDFGAAAGESKWGAQDETVAARLLTDLGGTAQPFFVTWLTLSSHEPFEVPGPVRVTGATGEDHFLNSLAYTDHVLGDFLRRASAQPWWPRTLVIIVADHSKKLERTDAGVPYKSAESWYHIPMLWTGGALAWRGRTIDRLMSQTDLAPTLLSQLGIPGKDQYQFGRDQLNGPAPGWIYYGFDDGFGLVTNRGSLVWEHAPGRITSRSGVTTDQDLRLGRALLQTTFQDYLNR